MNATEEAKANEPISQLQQEVHIIGSMFGNGISGLGSKKTEHQIKGLENFLSICGIVNGGFPAALVLAENGSNPRAPHLQKTQKFHLAIQQVLGEILGNDINQKLIETAQEHLTKLQGPDQSERQSETLAALQQEIMSKILKVWRPNDVLLEAKFLKKVEDKAEEIRRKEFETLAHTVRSKIIGYDSMANRQEEAGKEKIFVHLRNFLDTNQTLNVEGQCENSPWVLNEGFCPEILEYLHKIRTKYGHLFTIVSKPAEQLTEENFIAIATEGKKFLEEINSDWKIINEEAPRQEKI